MSNQTDTEERGVSVVDVQLNHEFGLLKSALIDHFVETGDSYGISALLVCCIAIKKRVDDNHMNDAEAISLLIYKASSIYSRLDVSRDDFKTRLSKLPL